MAQFVGIDFGTSGARIMVIDGACRVSFEKATVFETSAEQVDPQVWSKTLLLLLDSIPLALKPTIQRIAIDGTSSTVLLCDRLGIPVAPPKLYNHSCAPEVMMALKTIAPPEHICLSSTSSLAKLWSWQENSAFSQARFLLHQADWLAAQLHGQLGLSDYHNSLKLGFDPGLLAYPDWFDQMGIDLSLLPTPLRPGVSVDLIQPSVAGRLGLPPTVQICAGTTDSIAAFLASGAEATGEAVTSLGSTIALKLLSEIRVDASSYGVYSHWFGRRWLVGGASNAGGAVLRKFFSDTELAALSQQIDWSQDQLPDYIPLVHPGERFPVNDPNLQPCFEPRIEEPVDFLQAILVSLTRIEVEGYQKLEALGASSLERLFTAGGGAKNLGWMKWRQMKLGVPVIRSQQPDAAFGAARLAAGVLEHCL